WKFAEGFANCIEHHAAWPRHPAAVNRRWLARRNLPIGRESAEMIDADDVGESQCRAKARDPPSISPLAHDIPSIQRISPTLSSRRAICCLLRIAAARSGDPRARAC